MIPFFSFLCNDRIRWILFQYANTLYVEFMIPWSQKTYYHANSHPLAGYVEKNSKMATTSTNWYDPTNRAKFEITTIISFIVQEISCSITELPSTEKGNVCVRYQLAFASLQTLCECLSFTFPSHLENSLVVIV